ncbi:hypothetical protein NC661_06775 [Aquibacillus koreensis]|uniref:Uncharacterized protein n=1 Tax=Aquibacillus koreensis TaxID=279446 RepID=A0A9X4AJ36_9BACI|nr:hypothetical protein [Aquibacillus koreensis]MCT2535645.1 hypothetical protein [Aquibacillus koreensis]MDC3420070.1 hypothetical protein [Aquibacillus koreensis]
MIYLFFFLIGFGLTVSGGISIILYLNFIPAGLTFIDYLIYIQGRIECYSFFLGVIIMAITINKVSKITVKK